MIRPRYGWVYIFEDGSRVSRDSFIPLVVAVCERLKKTPIHACELLVERQICQRDPFWCQNRGHRNRQFLKPRGRCSFCG